MLEWRMNGIRYRVSLLFPALMTALLLWQPEGLAATCLLASLIHEGGHLAAMVALGAPPHQCVLGAFGMRIELQNRLVGYGKNLLISFAGPLTNGVAAAILYDVQCPAAAAVHLVLAVLNLLPVAALDGGEILRCALCLLGRERLARPLLRLTSLLVLLPLLAVSIRLCIKEKNPTLLIVGAYLAALLIFLDKSKKNS